MPLTYTLASLKTSIQSSVEDTNADFVAALDEIVAQGEQKAQADLDMDSFDSTGSATTSNGVATLSKPAGLVAERSVFVTVASVVTPVIRKSLAFVTEYNAGAANGTPRYYAENASGQFTLAPPPAGAYPVSFAGVYQAQTLVDAPAGSWLSLNMPTLLFYAVKIFACDYLKKWAAKEQAERQYQSLLDNHLGIKRNAKRTDIQDVVGGLRTDQQPAGPAEQN